MSISGLAMISRPSATTLTPSPTMDRARSTSRSATIVISMARPARRRISSWLRVRTLYVPEPTVPMPSRPTWIAFIFISPRVACSFGRDDVGNQAGKLPGPARLHAAAQAAGGGIRLLETEPRPRPALGARAVAGAADGNARADRGDAVELA